MNELQSLEGIFDEEEVPRGITEFAEGKLAIARAPVKPWTRVGFSGSVLAVVEFVYRDTRGREIETEKLIVKVLPKGPHKSETGRHDVPWRLTPDFAENYLVRQRYPRYPLRDGRYLMFQAIPYNLSDSKTVRELSPAHQAEACWRIAHLVSIAWNRLDKNPVSAQVQRTTALEYLTTELRGALDEGKAAYRWAAQAGLTSSERQSLTIEGEMRDRLPNPVLMALPNSVLKRVFTPCITGHAHGDLHWDNALVLHRPGREPDFDRIRLVDLSDYETEAPITRDVVTLILHVTADAVRRRLTSDEAEGLLRFTINPWERPAHFAKGAVLDAIGGAYSVIDHVAPEWQDEWRTQYLLSMHAQALTFTAFDDIGQHWHWWYTRLAARATQTFLEQHQEPIALTTNQPLDRPAAEQPIIQAAGTGPESNDRTEPTSPDTTESSLIEVADKIVARANRIGSATSPEDLITLVEPLRQQVAELDARLHSMASPRPDDALPPSTRRIDVDKALNNAQFRTGWLLGILPRTFHGARIAVENGSAVAEQAEAVHTAVTTLVTNLGGEHSAS